MKTINGTKIQQINGKFHVVLLKHRTVTHTYKIFDTFQEAAHYKRYTLNITI
jgi:hypothetical protein